MARRIQNETTEGDSLYRIPEAGQEADAPQRACYNAKTDLTSQEAWARAYFKRIKEEFGNQPRLTLEEEIELAKVMEAGRDAEKKLEERQETHTLNAEEAAALQKQIAAGEEAKKRLIYANLYVVGVNAKKHRSPEHSFEELFYIGFVELSEGVERYDYRKGCLVSTYVWQGVEGKIQEAFWTAQQNGLTKGMRRNYKTILEAMEEFQREEGREPSQKELSQKTGISVAEIRHLEVNAQSPVSLQEMEESRKDPVAVEPDEPEVLFMLLLLLLVERYDDQLTDPLFCEDGTLEAVTKLCRLEFDCEKEQKKKKKPALSAKEQEKVRLWIERWHWADLVEFITLPQKAFGHLLTPRTAAWFLEQYGDRIPRAEMRAAMEAFSQLKLCQLTDDNAAYRLLSEQLGGRQVRAIWDSCTKWLYQNYQNEIDQFLLETRLSHPPANQQNGS